MEYNEAEGRMLQELMPALSALLRQELNALHMAYAQLITPSQRENDPWVDHSAAKLDRSFYRLLRLANNLSDAELLAGEPALLLQNIDLMELLGVLCRKAQGPAALLGLNLDFVCRERACVAAVDKQLIERLLWNLLSNAMAATPAGGQLRVSLRVERDVVLLAVSDTGRGLDPELLTAQPLARLQSVPDSGIGLGLPLCRRIAQLHGGTLLLTAREGEGSTVTVRLPLRRTEQQTREPAFDYTGGFNQALMELADVLPEEAFAQRYLD